MDDIAPPLAPIARPSVTTVDGRQSAPVRCAAMPARGVTLVRARVRMVKAMIAVGGERLHPQLSFRPYLCLIVYWHIRKPVHLPVLVPTRACTCIALNYLRFDQVICLNAIATRNPGPHATTGPFARSVIECFIYQGYNESQLTPLIPYPHAYGTLSQLYMYCTQIDYDCYRTIGSQ